MQMGWAIMKIIYKQTEFDTTLKSLGVENCYLKHLSAKTDSKSTLSKEHHHTGFEIHFMNLGHQKYIIEESICICNTNAECSCNKIK